MAFSFFCSNIFRLKTALILAMLSAFMAGPARAERVSLLGLNLSGAGFASQVLPGVNGTHYIFPTESYFSQWSGRGVKLIRFPILWERLQPVLGGPLDPTYAALIDRTFNYAQKYDIKIILDLHNYMRYRGVVIGTGNVSYMQYKDVLVRIAQRWSTQSSLYAYDIMNEPHDAVAQWATAAQYGIDGVRSIDSVRPIMIEGNGWAEATRWPQWNDTLLGLKDPANNLIYQAHVYFDGVGGGGNYTNTSATAYGDDFGMERVRPFVEWLKKNGKRGMIGEFGVPDSDGRWNVIMGNMLAYLKQNCMPATYWAAGPGWANYNLSVEPVNGVERPQWPTLRKYLDDTSCTGIGPVQITQGAIAKPNANSAYAGTVKQLYIDYLGREAEPAGLSYWTGLLDSGTMSLAAVINSFFNSGEYQNRSYVWQLYNSYMGRIADQAGLAYWAGLLNSGTMTREQVKSALLHSEEAMTVARDGVVQAYRTYLGREPDGAGLNYWIQQITDGNATLDNAIAAMKSSVEYRSLHQ